MRLARTASSAATVAAEARLRGATVGIVEGPRSGRRCWLRSARRCAPGLPRATLDALEECLHDLSWLPVGEVVLVSDGSEALRAADPMAHRQLVEVLGAASERTAAERPVRAVLTGIAERPAPE